MKFTTSLTPAAGLMALGLALAGPALADDSATRTVGPQADGSIVASDNQTLTPAGQMVLLGSHVRAKAVALNPINNTAAVLLMGASRAVNVINLTTGQVIQTFTPFTDTNGSYAGITYSADGRYLLFSQDDSYVAIARVNATTGLLADQAHVNLPATKAIPLYTSGTAYPGGVAVTSDNKSAFVVLNQNNTIGVIDVARQLMTYEIAVGNAPHSIVLYNDLAYVSNEGGRHAGAADFTNFSSGTPIVVDPKTASASTGTVSVIDLVTGKVIHTINVGLHPTGMALWGSYLLVANAYSESLSVIDLSTNKVVRTIALPVPVTGAYGSMPCSIAVNGTVAYVTLATANAIAVVDLSGGTSTPVLGYIPTAYFPTSVAYSAAKNALVVTNDKGTGTQSAQATIYGVTAFNTHVDSGTVSIIPVPNASQLATYTQQVIHNNHWDLTANILVGPSYINPNAAPKAIPDHIGEPSLIKHVFLIIKENRTYDQILGDVAKGNGDSTLAVFAAATPNQHALIKRFPLLDNVYAPSRQSADGHPWIVSSIAAYADDIQSPDWIRSYPGGNSNDAMVYTPKGFLWQAAMNKGLSVKMYGEWSQNQIISGNHSWSDWYAYALWLEGGQVGPNPTTLTPTTDTETAQIPSVVDILDPHYPSFNTGIPDEYRITYWLPKFQHQEATHTLPALTIMWLPDDHTSGFYPGYPIPTAAQADNDLNLGRIVDAVSHSADWATTAIFVEEDDAQNGVDHVDGHRQPVYVISPYTSTPTGAVVHTTYTAENINRTIEQILGLTPLTQFDLVASPMRDVFTSTPDTTPFTHLPPTVPLNTFPTSSGENTSVKNAWMLASFDMFKGGKTARPDSVDENILNHVIWYASTNFVRPYPGETDVKLPAQVPAGGIDPDGDGDGL